MKTILVPVNSNLKNAPDNLLFAANHLENVALTMYGTNVNVKYLYYKQKNYNMRSIVLLNLMLMCKILTINHDILYYGTDPIVLGLIAFLKNLKIYRKPIYAWKYIALYKPKNCVSAWLKKWFYNSFDCIFMITEKHVGESVENGMINPDCCKYIEWGSDVSYVDNIEPLYRNDSIFTFVSTGKAFRDFDTLCSAFRDVSNAQLKIYTVKRWGKINYQDILTKYSCPNIEINFVDDLDLGAYASVYDYLLAELKAADCAMVICKKVNFGVGFTAVLDAMVCGCAMISTEHPDNPIDIDNCKIGETVPAEDVDALRRKIECFVQDKEKLETYCRNARELVECRYNIKLVAKNILAVMLKKCE